MVPEASGGAGWCEADCKDVVSEASAGAVTACRSVSCVAFAPSLLLCVWGGSTRFGSCFVGGLTWLGLCPGFQFIFVAALFALRFIVSSSKFGAVPWFLNIGRSRIIREGKAKGKRQGSRVCPTGSMFV